MLGKKAVLAATLKLLLLPALVTVPSPGFGAESDLPSLGDTSSSFMSQEQEYQLGRAWLSMLRGSVKTLDDPILKDFVEQRVLKLAETSQLSDKRLTFVAIDSPQLNAFAAPGGVIGVNGGLFLHAQSEAEFASVMAHELAHLSQRHFARNLEAQQRMRIPVMTAMLASVILAAAGGGDAGFAAMASTQAAAIQEQRRFSRQNEQEADRLGLLNLQQAGYDPQAMPAMFERLARLSQFDRNPPEFLLTHPVSQTRIADSKNRAAQINADGKRDSVSYQMIRARVQLHYEQSPGLAARRFRTLLDEHAGDHAAARYGLALALIRGGQLDEAGETLQPLLVERSEDITVNLAQVELDVARGRYAPALERIDEQLSANPGNYPLLEAKADTLMRARQYEQSQAVYDALALQRPEDADVWYMVAEVRGLAGDILGVHTARAEYFMLAGDLDQAAQQLGLAAKRAEGDFVKSSRIAARQEELARKRKLLESL